MSSLTDSQGVLEFVDHAKWETPIITSIKLEGLVCFCMGYKCTLNKVLQQHAYPVSVNYLLRSLAEGKAFSKLDLVQAFQQLPWTMLQQKPRRL